MENKSLPVQIAMGIILAGVICGVVALFVMFAVDCAETIVQQKEIQLEEQWQEHKRRIKEHNDSIYQSIGIITKQEFDSIAAEFSNDALDWEDYHSFVMWEGAFSREERDKHWEDYFNNKYHLK